MLPCENGARRMGPWSGTVLSLEVIILACRGACFIPINADHKGAPSAGSTWPHGFLYGLIMGEFLWPLGVRLESHVDGGPRNRARAFRTFPVAWMGHSKSLHRKGLTKIISKQTFTQNNQPGASISYSLLLLVSTQREHWEIVQRPDIRV